MRGTAIPDDSAVHTRKEEGAKSAGETVELDLHPPSLSHPDATVGRNGAGGIESHGAGEPRAVP